MKNKTKSEIGKMCYSRIKSIIESEQLTDNHCHDRYEILYVIDGKGRFILEGREYPIKQRTLIVIPPLEYHYINLSTGSIYERCVIHFTEGDLFHDCKKYLSAFNCVSEDRPDFYIADINSEPIIYQLEQMELIDGFPDSEKEIYFRMLLSQLVLLLSITGADKFSPSDDHLGARVIKYLNEHFERDVSLDALAKRFFVSKYYLCRAFKKHNGISVHGYINQKRIMYAKQLIEAGETASGAAYKVGFGDYSAFYRAYIKIVGKAPTAQDEE